jgi:hypothetical protein
MNKLVGVTYLSLNKLLSSSYQWLPATQFRRRNCWEHWNISVELSFWVDTYSPLL